MKVVLDTNIYLSALVFPDSKPALILYLAKRAEFSVFCSSFIILEIRRNLMLKFGIENEVVEKIIDDILQYVQLITPAKKTRLITAKSDDNLILDCALAAKAEFLVTGDKKHILPIKQIGKTEIVSAAEFIEKLKIIKNDWFTRRKIFRI